MIFHGIRRSSDTPTDTPMSVFVPHAQGVGDSNMAYQCFKLSLVYNNTHPEALNNLGVLEWKMGHGEVVRAAAYAY